MTDNGPDGERRSRYSALSSHIRQGKTLQPPLLRVGQTKLQSWTDKRLPEVIWAALLTSALPRDRYMNHLCSIAKAAMGFRESKSVFPDHSAIAAISREQFGALFGNVLADDAARQALSPMLVLQGLPDRAHWQSALVPGDKDHGWSAIADAVFKCYDRRERPAIDIRWLRVMFLALQHRLVFPEGQFDDIVKMLCDYPNGTEPDWASATIGALEMATKQIFIDSWGSWEEIFWKEYLENTPCILGEIKPPPTESSFDYEPAKKRWGEIYVMLFDHFMRSIVTTDVDPRHDAVFGLALYGMSLVVGMMRPFSTRPSGRHLLRSLAEVYISGAYLAFKDDPNLWRMYREYGTGQSKLTFLKLIERDMVTLPYHIDLKNLESLANEDRWQEFVSIDLGHWANLNLRKMAQDAGVKDVYDAYYDWPSGFVHGHWGAVRDSVFGLCWNPLHRFHRIPRPTRTDMEDVCPDAIKIMNRLLDVVDRCYPSFGVRFDEPTPGSTGQDETSA